MSQHCRANPCCGDVPCSGIPLPQHASGLTSHNKRTESTARPPAVPGEVETAQDTISKILEMVEGERSEWQAQGRHDCAHVAEMIRDNIQHFWGNERDGGDKGDGWQPIETASAGILLLYFPAITGRNRNPEMIRVDHFPVSYPRKPTHWMPLPTAPSASIEGETKP